MSDADRIADLRAARFTCGQIIVSLALEMQGAESAPLVRAAGALAGGLGYTGDVCGALTGGALALGAYAGRGRDGEDDDPRLVFMVEDLVAWFRDGFGAEFGGIQCREILAPGPAAQATRCPLLVEGTFRKVKELLVTNEIELTRVPDADD